MKGCGCGQPTRAAQTSPDKRFPVNPAVQNGVSLIYLASGRREFKGSETGLVYTVGENRRDFVADAADVKGLLRHRFVILR